MLDHCLCIQFFYVILFLKLSYSNLLAVDRKLKNHALELQNGIIKEKMNYNDILLASYQHKDISCHNKSIVYYVSSSEGFIALYKQIEEMWLFARSLNKCLKLFAHQGHDHFNNMGNISMCYYYNLPDDILCLPYQYYYYLPNSLQCRIVKGKLGMKHMLYELQRTYDLKKISLVDEKRINFTSANCITGRPVKTIEERVNSVFTLPHGGRKIYFNHSNIWTLQMEQKYREVIELMNILPDDKFIVAHWRRGDQLMSRCRGAYGGLDQSANCVESIDEMITDYETLINLACSNFSNSLLYKRYIATNEKNISILQNLNFKGYLTFPKTQFKLVNDTVGYIINKNGQMISMSYAEEYVIETMLVCRSICFFGFGVSTLNNFANLCRKEYSKYINQHLVTAYLNTRNFSDFMVNDTLR